MKPGGHSVIEIVSFGARRFLQRSVRLIARADRWDMRWRLGVPDEIRFWSRWIETQGGVWTHDFTARLDPGRPLLPELAELVHPASERVRILDVGAGPISYVGLNHPDFEVEVVAIDPLAEKYSKLLDDAGVDPPVRTVAGNGEDLLNVVDAGSFDLAYSRNALDHSWDPYLCIEQMLAALRPGGSILLQHAVNEGERERYAGLHQWNFEDRNGHLVIWDGSQTIDVNEALGSSVDIEVWRTDVGAEPWVMAVIHKPPICPN